MSMDHGSRAAPMVRFRDVLRSEIERLSKRGDQVSWGLVSAVEDARTVTVLLDGMEVAVPGVTWALSSVPVAGERVICVSMWGGQDWTVVGSLAAGGGHEHDHDSEYAALVHAARHALGGADPVSPASIGAAEGGHDHDAAYAALAHAAEHAEAGADPVSPASIGAAASGHDHDSAYAAALHAAQHFTAGSDEISPADIGAAADTHGHDFDDLDDVSVASPSDGDGIIFDSGSGLWVVTDLDAAYAAIGHGHNAVGPNDELVVSDTAATFTVPVTAPNLPRGHLAAPVFLTSDVPGLAGNETDITGFNITFTVPVGRLVRLEAFVYRYIRTASAAAGQRAGLKITDNSNNPLGGQASTSAWYDGSTTVRSDSVRAVAFWTPGAGTHTVKARFTRFASSATHTLEASVDEPAYLIAVDEGPA